MDAIPLSYRMDPPRPELGALLASVAMLVGEKRSAVLHITAARHGEGTTTIARDLAAAAARPAWCRVALVDASLAGTGSPSLLDALERGNDPILRQGRVGDSDVALGCLPGLATGAARVESLRSLFTWMRSQFTVVVIDSPPVLSCREAAIIGAVADATLMVVEAEHTSREDIGHAREVLEQLGATMLGVVLNKRRRRVPRFIDRLI